MTGCGSMLTLGNGTAEVCGTRYNLGVNGQVKLAPPLLCPTCQGRQALTEAGLPLSASEYQTLRQAIEDAPTAHEVRSGATCEACRVSPATSEGPALCAPCRAEYDHDLAVEAEIRRAQHDARCRCRGCGHA